jgi:hypothetical protein
MNPAQLQQTRREQEEAMWGEVQPKSERSGAGGGSPQARLERGQTEEAEGVAPVGAKPKFVKITSGVHVQTRGPILLVRFAVVSENTKRRAPSPWFIFQLPGEKRLSGLEGRDEIFDWISQSERLGYPETSVGDAKGQARAFIWAAEGRLGS